MPPLRRFKILNKGDMLHILRWVIDSIESLCLIKLKKKAQAKKAGEEGNEGNTGEWED